MNKGKVELVSFESDSEFCSYVYSVEQNNGSTSVEQNLTIAGTEGLRDYNWTASIALDDFPPQPTPEAAALKLADWLERLAGALRTGEYENFKRASFKDIEGSSDD